MSGFIDDVSVEQEIATLRMGRPHLVLLGAGASKAALPAGDRFGRPVPLLREIARELNLDARFPVDLRDLARSDFEAAYSQLVDRGAPVVSEIETLIRDYFLDLRLPPEPNLYDYLNMCLRAKDVIFTFNWDPLIVDSQIRLYQAGVELLPKVYALHGNVAIGYCEPCQQSGLGMVGRPCGRCGRPYAPSRLLYPVMHKDYVSDPFIYREWQVMRKLLNACFMFTVFGYSAPDTDVEAVELLKEAWGDTSDRAMEETEIIERPGSDHDQLREKWNPFIHSHHYGILDDFFKSWMVLHPRRTGEAYASQFWDAQFISENPVPRGVETIDELVAWFEPLLEVERASSDNPLVGTATQSSRRRQGT